MDEICLAAGWIYAVARDCPLGMHWAGFATFMGALTCALVVSISIATAVKWLLRNVRTNANG